MVKEKKSAHRTFKRGNLYCDYLVFAKLRTDWKAAAENCWSSYICKTENSIAYNLKTFWKFVNSNIPSNTSPIVMHHNGLDVISPREIADSFAMHFESTYTVDSTQSLPSTTTHNLDVCCLTIGIDEVFDKINALDGTKGPGDDGLPPLFFKLCPFAMSRILWIIFNLSFKTGKFPTR